MNKSYVLLLAFTAFLVLASCALMAPQTEGQAENGVVVSETVSADTTLATVPPKPTIRLTQAELEKYAYEIGLDPRQALTEDQKIQIDKRRKLRLLERALDSHKERQQYSKVLPWLKSDDEKLDYLSIPSIEGRQAWINKNKIWARQKELKNYVEVMESQDIAVGMPLDYVRKSWGEPTHIEVSGNPIYKNERWKYLKQVSTPQGYRQEQRLVYFEGGRVVGWETE
ncbi:MAG: hypothetical protein H7061_07550 [Bdellovibrionaceae bacterium]|nr:hypothetical protein [Bdellovibrio sp.]